MLFVLGFGEKVMYVVVVWIEYGGEMLWFGWFMLCWVLYVGVVYGVGGGFGSGWGGVVFVCCGMGKCG